MAEGNDAKSFASKKLKLSFKIRCTQLLYYKINHKEFLNMDTKWNRIVQMHTKNGLLLYFSHKVSNAVVGLLEMMHTVVNTSNDMFSENLYRYVVVKNDDWVAF